MASRREFAVGEAPQGGAISGVGAQAPCVIPRRVFADFQIPGAGAATAVATCFFTAEAPPDGSGVETTAAVYQVAGIRCRYEHVGGAGALLNINKVPSGTAPGAGVACQAAGFDLTQPANIQYKKTVLAGGLSATLANLQLAPGDSLAVVTSGTLTALTDLSVTVELKRIAFQH